MKFLKRHVCFVFGWDILLICSDVFSTVIIPVVLSNVLRPLVAFGSFWALFGIVIFPIS